MSRSESSVPFLDLRVVNARYRDELLEVCARVIDSGWYIGGAELEAFEQEFAAYCGVQHCVGVGNGLDALTLTLPCLEGSGALEGRRRSSGPSKYLYCYNFGDYREPIETGPGGAGCLKTFNIDSGRSRGGRYPAHARDDVGTSILKGGANSCHQGDRKSPRFAGAGGCSAGPWRQHRRS